MDRREVEDFFDKQVKVWSLASKNYKDLEKSLKKCFKVKDLEGYIQCNPARVVSTLAVTDKETIKKRKCFLCKENRPGEQKGYEIIPEWELLVNPFPILPYHFTIVSKLHLPQKFYPEIGFKLAEKLSGMVVFYNDDGAGASAPDHLHFQAVPLEELPLIDLIDKNGVASNLVLPFKIIENPEEVYSYNRPVNAFFWVTEKGEKKFIAIPRKKHRPHQYFMNFPDRRTVSPGAIDMAGVIVTPFIEDFELLDSKDMEDIFSQVACSDE